MFRAAQHDMMDGYSPSASRAKEYQRLLGLGAGADSRAGGCSGASVGALVDVFVDLRWVFLLG